MVANILINDAYQMSDGMIAVVYWFLPLIGIPLVLTFLKDRYSDPSLCVKKGQNTPKPGAVKFDDPVKSQAMKPRSLPPIESIDQSKESHTDDYREIKVKFEYAI